MEIAFINLDERYIFGFQIEKMGQLILPNSCFLKIITAMGRP